MNMQIEIIKTSETQKIESTIEFGVILNNFISIIKMLHWYSKDYNTHVILGDLYDTLTVLFDKLQEEIIGTSDNHESTFPQFNSNDFDINNIDCNKNSIESYLDYSDKLKNILISIDFNRYLNSTTSGINNTKEDILSAINKTNYLLTMVNKNH